MVGWFRRCRRAAFRGRHLSVPAATVTCLAGILLVLTFIGVGGCAKSMHGITELSAEAPMPEGMAAPPVPPMPAEAREKSVVMDEAGGAFGESESPTPLTDRKLIRTADMSIEVDVTEDTLAQIKKLATSAGGFVGNTSISRYEDGSQHGSVTLRVPVGKFESILDKLRELGKLRQMNTDVQDVTAQYVDLEARIRNSEREEKEVLKLFDRGGKLEDIIQVESKLAEVRERIELYQGQIRVMKEQVALSTITINVFEKGEAAVAETDKYDVGYHFRSAGRALLIFLRGLLTFLIYFIIVGWVIWLPVGLLIWRLVVRRRARRAQAPPAQ